MFCCIPVNELVLNKKNPLKLFMYSCNTVIFLEMSESKSSTSSSTSLFTPSANNVLHSSFGHPLLKSWNSERRVEAEHILYPIFVHDKDGEITPIKSLPGQSRWPVDKLPELLDPLIAIGLRSVILFGVLSDDSKKDTCGSHATADDTPVLRALQFLAEKYPKLLLVTDVCLCAYTSHGHCGILTKDNAIDNQPSIDRLAEMAVAHAKASPVIRLLSFR